MTEYTYLLNDENFYTCKMSDLRTTTFKRLKDIDKKTLFNRYLCLLADHALPVGKKDFSIEIKCDIIDDIVHLHIGTAYPFMAKFDLSKEFDETSILNSLNDINLMLSGTKRMDSLDAFAKTKILFDTEEQNNKLSEYLNFIADDLTSLGLNHDIQYCILSHPKIFKLEMWLSYPFLKTYVTLKLDIEKPFNPEMIIRQLDELTNNQVQDCSANCFVRLSDGQRFLETISILDNVLCCAGEIQFLYTNYALYNRTSHRTFSFFNVSVHSSELILEFESKRGTQINIQISQNSLSFKFNKSSEELECFTWKRTADIDYDTKMIQRLFIMYFEKIRGYEIIDLKREFQLIEMEII